MPLCVQCNLFKGSVRHLPQNFLYLQENWSVYGSVCVRRLRRSLGACMLLHQAPRRQHLHTLHLHRRGERHVYEQKGRQRGDQFAGQANPAFWRKWNNVGCTLRTHGWPRRHLWLWQERLPLEADRHWPRQVRDGVGAVQEHLSGSPKVQIEPAGDDESWLGSHPPRRVGRGCDVHHHDQTRLRGQRGRRRGPLATLPRLWP